MDTLSQLYHGQEACRRRVTARALVITERRHLLHSLSL
jgi:hypothetical protein